MKCPKCGFEIQENLPFCPKCGVDLDEYTAAEEAVGTRELGESRSEEGEFSLTGEEPVRNHYYEPEPSKVRFYQKTWLIGLALIFFWPIGVILMWKFAKWNKIVKIIISILCVFALIGLFTGNDNQSADTSDSSSVIEEVDDTASGSGYGIKGSNATEIMNTLKEEYGIELDADPLDPSINEGVEQLDYYTEGDNWYEIDMEVADKSVLCAEFTTNVKDLDYLKRSIELIASNKDDVEKIEEWFDNSINAEMSYEELDSVNESFECDNVDYSIGTIVGEDYQTKEPYARVSLSVWSIPYRENVASNH